MQWIGIYSSWPGLQYRCALIGHDRFGMVELSPTSAIVGFSWQGFVCGKHRTQTSTFVTSLSDKDMRILTRGQTDKQIKEEKNRQANIWAGRQTDERDSIVMKLNAD